ncbi:MAG: DPP IV N-terminal domain-containing protein [Bacteroidia bacterium]
MKRIIALLVLISSFTVSIAQDKKLLSIEDISVNYSLYARELSQCNWIPESSMWSHVKNDTIFIKTAENKNYYTIGLEEINESFAAIESQIGEKVELSRMPYIRWHNLNTFSFSTKMMVFTCGAGKSRDINLLFKIPAGAANLEYDVTTGNYSFTMENDLYVNGKKISNAEEDVVYGQTVHRNEFGINKGTFWSENFGKLAFYKNDQSPVSDYPMLNITTRVAEPNMIKYPMAGDANEIVRLGVYDVKSGNTVYMNTGDADQYLTNITWDPNGKYVYIGVLNRGQDHLKWQKYNSTTGELVKTLFEEMSESFVEPLNPLYFNSKRPNEFIWKTWRDGYTHLYRYNNDGKLLNQVTKGDFEVTSFVGFGEKGKYIYYMSAEDSPLEKQLYRVSISGGRAKKITSARGQHSIRKSDKGDYIIDSYSNRSAARKMALISSTGKLIKEIHDAGDPLVDYVKNGVEFGTIKAKDGKTDLYYRIIKPYNFDPSNKYPVVQYVYGGPHAQMITENWNGNASLFLHYLAQQGFIVFTVDNRGSDNRGAAFEQITHRQLGTIEMEDQLTGLEFIKNQQYVDADRIAIHGWSFGGFMTTSLMLRSPGSYKVGVCGGPVIDWKYYEIMYTERYMDTPQENPEGFEAAALTNYVENLEGKLLIVHGADDDVVVWQHTLAFVDECVANAVLFDYFPYPGHKHHVRGKDRIHLQKYMAQYFIDNL